MVQFIKQIRSYYENRYPTKTVPNAPFVLATLATNGGWGNTDPGSGKVAQAQLNVDGSTGKYPEFAGNVKTMEARGYWRDTTISPSGQGYHYNWNAETYLLVGDALGRGMVELLSADDYGTWSATFPGAALGDPNTDLDRDGLSNDHERIWGLDPTRGSSAHPLTSTAAIAAGTFSYTRRSAGLTGKTFTIWTSTDLELWTEDNSAVQTPGTAVNQIETVAVTLSPGLTASPKLFVQVRALP